MLEKYRKYVTTGVGFAFLVVGTTGVTFKLFFKTHTLEEIHGWAGIWLVLFVIFHIAQNWQPLARYLKNPRVYWVAIPLLAIILSETFNPENKEKPGMNPRAVVHKLVEGHFSDIAKVFGKDENAVEAAMKQDGLKITTFGATLEEIARENNKPAEQLLPYFAK